MLAPALVLRLSIRRGIIAKDSESCRADNRLPAFSLLWDPAILSIGELEKLRRRALSMLAGNEGRLRGDLTGATAASLRRLMVEQEYRFAILFGLVRLNAAPRIMSLVSDFAASSDEMERRMAGRALGGERVIHIDRYAGDDEMRRRIMQTCDIAHGRMYYWLRRDDIAFGEGPACSHLQTDI